MGAAHRDILRRSIDPRAGRLSVRHPTGSTRCGAVAIVCDLVLLEGGGRRTRSPLAGVGTDDGVEGDGLAAGEVAVSRRRVSRLAASSGASAWKTRAGAGRGGRERSSPSRRGSRKGSGPGRRERSGRCSAGRRADVEAVRDAGQEAVDPAAAGDELERLQGAEHAHLGDSALSAGEHLRELGACGAEAGRGPGDQAEAGGGGAGVDHGDPFPSLLLGEHPGGEPGAVVHAAEAGQEGAAEDLLGLAAAEGVEELPGRRRRGLRRLAGAEPGIEAVQPGSLRPSISSSPIRTGRSTMPTVAVSSGAPRRRCR